MATLSARPLAVATRLDARFMPGPPWALFSPRTSNVEHRAVVNHHALRTRNAPRVGRCAQARGQAPFPHAGGAISIDGPTRPSPIDSAADVGAALAPRFPELSADIYQLIVREIPSLRGGPRVLTLLEVSVAENVAAVLHIVQHDIDLEKVHAPAAAEEYDRRLAQRLPRRVVAAGTPARRTCAACLAGGRIGREPHCRPDGGDCGSERPGLRNPTGDHQLARERAERRVGVRLLVGLSRHQRFRPSL